MTEDWYARRNDRQLRYAGRVLPTGRPIALSIDPDYANTYDGQVATLVAANLLARMTPSLAFDIPRAPIVGPLPWAGTELLEAVLCFVRGADPHADFEVRSVRDGDYLLRFGRGPSSAVVHGSGWYAFVGPGRSNIPDSKFANPIGPSFAAILAAARLFGSEMRPLDGPYLFNAFRWNSALESDELPFRGDCDLNTIWTVGAGSVGTAALYFLTLATRRFRSLTFDMDIVKTENLDRSPIFTAADAEHRLHKADVAAAYLRGVGVVDAQSERSPLDEAVGWSSRGAGTPDLVIAAANERNVRYVIEQSCPPLQIYGTTGRNWVASVIRHIPLVEACSCCVFPPMAEEPSMTCAQGQVPTAIAPSDQAIDAALPFLSFAAGLMAAAEVFKANLPGFPFSASRTVFSVAPSITPRFTSVNNIRRESCVCSHRNAGVHRQMIAGSSYESLSS